MEAHPLIHLEPDLKRVLSLDSSYRRLKALADELEACKCIPLTIKTYSNHLLISISITYCAVIGGVERSCRRDAVRWLSTEPLSLMDVNAAQTALQAAGVTVGKAREMVDAKIRSNHLTQSPTMEV